MSDGCKHLLQGPLAFDRLSRVFQCAPYLWFYSLSRGIFSVSVLFAPCKYCHHLRWRPDYEAGQPQNTVTVKMVVTDYEE